MNDPNIPEEWTTKKFARKVRWSMFRTRVRLWWALPICNRWGHKPKAHSDRLTVCHRCYLAWVE